MKKRILCFGDSNTYGANPNWNITVPKESGISMRWPEDVRWTKVLQSLLGSSEYEIIEEGLCGRTTIFPDFVYHITNGREYISPCIYSHNPLDLIVIMLGTNDIKPENNPSAYMCMTAMDELIKAAKNPALYESWEIPKILIVSPIYLGDNLKETFMSAILDEKSYLLSKQLPEIYQMVANKHGCEFLNAADYASASLVDAVHMDAEDHRKLAEALNVKIRQIFEKGDETQ